MKSPSKGRGRKASREPPPERTPATFGHVAGRHLDYLLKSNTKAYSFAWYQIPLLVPPGTSQRHQSLEVCPVAYHT